MGDHMDLNSDGRIEFSEFVAACLDLGSKDLEEDLRRVFESADTDDDGFLVKDDIAKLMVSDEMRGKEAVKEVFQELAGRADQTAKVDWGMFRQHLTGRGPSVNLADLPPGKLAGPGGYAVDHEESRPSCSRTTLGPFCSGPSRVQNVQCAGPSEIMEQVGEFFGMARDLVLQAEPFRQEPSESDLRQMEAMGLKDRKKNLAALRRYGSVQAAVLALTAS